MIGFPYAPMRAQGQYTRTSGDWRSKVVARSTSRKAAHAKAPVPRSSARRRPRYIRVRGAREHNLQNLDLNIPRDRLVIITGVSGSGKSSLAFDTIYAEGQRRYVESLSPYARQFLQQSSKPDVEQIEGLPPTISIEQRASAANPRSTVATTTEIYDFLRLLYARLGTPYCYKCGRHITQQTPQQIIDAIMRTRPDTRLMVLAPLVRGRRGEHREVLARARREGFVRVRVDGVVANVGDVVALKKTRKHTIEVVVDRLVMGEGVRSRLADSVELALRLGEGLVVIARETKRGWRDRLFSQLYACHKCGISLEELSPRRFSFNSPYGACPTCDGLGTKLELDPDLIVPDAQLSLAEGAIDAWSRGGRRMAAFYRGALEQFAQDFGVSLHTPFGNLSEEARRILLFGTTREQARAYGASFVGVVPNLEQRFRRTESQYVKERLHAYMSELPCPACKGARLRPEIRAIRIADKAIHEVCQVSVDEAEELFSALRFTGEKAVIARPILKEIRSRLRFLVDVGLGYLTLARSSATLSGGEAQRIRLGTQVGSGLVGVCYVLDEPTIGLHQRDNLRLVETLERLRDLGNTVIVVEHDEETIRHADYLIDLGPGAGALGGRVVAQGSLEKFLEQTGSLTVRYLRGDEQIPVPFGRREVRADEYVEVRGAREHNLKNLGVRFPLGVFCCVTGVSGSGKSTLVDEVLYRALARRLYRARAKPGEFDQLVGAENVDKVVVIDQSPIGRTPRSNPATYTGVFDQIRSLYARTADARIRGYAAGRFSFNVKGGRCEACQGQGTRKIEMHFLPDIYVTCEECKGTRYNRETLEVRYRGRNVAETLEMTVAEALEFFANFPKVKAMLGTLADVGLGYLHLGQPSTTLSGGEAQRVKLASELGKRSTGNTFYILDEPTTGLHYADVRKLLDVLNRLVELGNTVLVIEHNLEVIKCADYIIDLGPEGGEAGGEIVAQGTPEEVAACPTSHTGSYLRQALARGRRPLAQRRVAPSKLTVASS